MAADEALLEAAAAGIASLRFYGWSQPTLSLGYFQAAEAARSFPRLGELAWVRRPSGGAALVHHLEVTYALALPPGAPWQKRGESWLWRMHGILRDALAALGVAVRLCGEEEGQKRGEVLCFLHHTPGDVLIGEDKITGSAQRKMRGALLQHGSLLLTASPFTPQLPGSRELTGQDISPHNLCSATIESFTHHTGWKIEPAAWDDALRRRSEEIAAAKYTQNAWNGKR